jgi:cell division protein FtsL
MSARPGETKVQLGCGTLIIIAIIVMIFSGGRDSSRLKNEVKELNEKIDRLEKKIDDLSKRLEQDSTPSSAARTETMATSSPSP